MRKPELAPNSSSIYLYPRCPRCGSVDLREMDDHVTCRNCYWWGPEKDLKLG